MTFLTVTLSVTLPTPLKVNAVTEDDTKKLYVIGTIASYAGINIDVDEVAESFPNFLSDIMDLSKDIYDEYVEEYGWTNDHSGGGTSGGGGSGRHRDDGVISSSDDLEDYLKYITKDLQPYNPISHLIDYRFIFCVIRAIKKWCSEHLNNASIGSGDNVGSVSVAGGYIDFYTRGSVAFTFPQLTSGTSYTVHFPLNNCLFTYYVNPSINLARSLWFRSYIPDSSYDLPVSNSLYGCIYPNNYDIYFCWWYSDTYSTSNISGRTFLNDAWGGVTSGSSWSLLSHAVGTNTPLYFFNSSGYFCSDGELYQISAYGNKYAFVCIHDASLIYNNLTFDSPFLALKYFFDLCGINISSGSSSQYVAVSTDPSPIAIDQTIYDQTISNITTTVTNSSYQEGDAVTMVFPSYNITNNYYNYDDYRQHPEYIFDFDQDGLLNSDFNMPSYDGNILATKFPFCIPFDVYNLVSNLVATPEAPQFHWLVLPANSFGMTNDDFYIDLDFTPYNFLVYLMRFFIAIGFVVWLMVKTKELMQ